MRPGPLISLPAKPVALALAMLAQLPVQRGAAGTEVGGDLFEDHAVPGPLGGSGGWSR